MAVGKASIKRAVNAGKAAAKAVASPEIQEAVKTAEAAPEVKETGAKKASAKKPAAEKKAAATRKRAAKKNTEGKEQVNPNRPVHITEEMPIHLL